MSETYADYTCDICKKVFPIPMSHKQKALLLGPNHLRPHMQDLFPELTAGLREIMISGYCSECFDKLFDNQEAEQFDLDTPVF